MCPWWIQHHRADRRKRRMCLWMEESQHEKSENPNHQESNILATIMCCDVCSLLLKIMMYIFAVNGPMQGMGTKWMLTTLLVMQEVIVQVSFICLINIFTNNLILTHVHGHKPKSNRSFVYRLKINHERVVHCAFFILGLLERRRTVTCILYI